jgi:hypothetical protein
MTYVYAEHAVQLSEERIAVWWDQFRHVSIEDAGKAARALVARKSYGAPKAQDFSEVLAEVSATEQERETWGEAWDKFSRIALRYGVYRVEHILPAVEKVSPLAAAAMATGVKEYLTSQETDVPTIRAQFRQRYEALQSRQRLDKRMPADMQRRIDGAPTKPTAVGDVVSKLMKQLEAK